jgi:hypothetical protein
LARRCHSPASVALMNPDVVVPKFWSIPRLTQGLLEFLGMRLHPGHQSDRLPDLRGRERIEIFSNAICRIENDLERP